ncbi:hypothetical protein FOQG_15060 [Fusarium oxysporum f. sp. raphani 54005]|uniref:Uncharacterized protein n=2 Tax=Fusarium oxysporum TaxID=5507 RepID=X0BPM4_FUSOX|nr:hypothetical protein FOQG_15060 [Fusarium oxysporum f. sp. raphani 54005]EXL64371.1 hypothetical protein FOPG_19364 [Fusarium oxysporum f. sp. conglutinans race 2 54008]
MGRDLFLRKSNRFLPDYGSFGKGSTYAKLLKVAPSKNSVKKATQTEKGEERASGAS